MRIGFSGARTVPRYSEKHSLIRAVPTREQNSRVGKILDYKFHSKLPCYTCYLVDSLGCVRCL